MARPYDASADPAGSITGAGILVRACVASSVASTASATATRSALPTSDGHRGPLGYVVDVRFRAAWARQRNSHG